MSTEVMVVGSFFPSVLEDLQKKFNVLHVQSKEELAALDDSDLANIEGMASFGWGPAEVIDRFPKLKLISSFAVGYDNIAADYAASKKIFVTHTPNVLNDDVANTAIMLLLATMRKLVVQDRYLRDGRWEREGTAPLTRSVAGKTVGIVGLGRIGEAIAEKLSVFNCTTVYHSRNKKPGVAFQYYKNLVEMAENCDVMIVITPGGAATDKLINKKVIEALGPEGTLINVARGTVVDEKEMIAALSDGRLGAAGLDVYEQEPKVPHDLIALDNVVLLPHVASATWETRQAMADLMVENLITYFETGVPVTPVPECSHLIKGK
ncbi:MAG: 2-hydroxyacid dehydrogenase [Rhizobiaceae bacterium]